MRLPRVRFTVRTMMAAVAVAATIEINFRLAAPKGASQWQVKSAYFSLADGVLR